jgi:hypothetical protein
MSIATYLTSIEASRDAIRTKLVSMGLAVSGDQLERLAEVISNLVNQGAVKVSVKEGETYTIPAGFHNGSGTVTGVAGGGNYDLQAKTVTPTKSQQSVGPDEGYFGLSSVTVNAIPGVYQDTSKVTAEAGDVLSGKIIVLANGTVTVGTMPDNGAVSKTLDATTVSYTIPKGKHSGTGTVQIVLEEKSVTPTKSAQTITPTSGKVLSKVSVAAIPSQYQDVSPVNAAAADVLSGKKIVSSAGTVVSGTMPNNGTLAKTLKVNDSEIVLEEGYYSSGSKIQAPSIIMEAMPKKEEFEVEAHDHTFLKKVIIRPIPDKFQDVSMVTATPADVLLGKFIVTADGTPTVGAMPNKGGVVAEIDGLNQTSYAIPKGYHNGQGTVSLTDDIETRLAKI